MADDVILDNSFSKLSFTCYAHRDYFWNQRLHKARTIFKHRLVKHFLIEFDGSYPNGITLCGMKSLSSTAFRCGLPPRPVNSVLEISTVKIMGGSESDTPLMSVKATYECKDNFTLRPSDESEFYAQHAGLFCGPLGEWTESPPKCIETVILDHHSGAMSLIDELFIMSCAIVVLGTFFVMACCFCSANNTRKKKGYSIQRSTSLDWFKTDSASYRDFVAHHDKRSSKMTAERISCPTRSHYHNLNTITTNVYGDSASDDEGKRQLEKPIETFAL